MWDVSAFLFLALEEPIPVDDLKLRAGRTSLQMLADSMGCQWDDQFTEISFDELQNLASCAME
jgi:hypothetical protein